MPSESSCTQRRPTATTKIHPITGCTPPPEPEHLPCPRCDSTNTKFCYYNNYNFSQPRHFCKACRRYWTHGGTLRDIPIGGGSRKNAKRSRLTSNHNPNSTLEFRHMAPPTATPILIPFAGEHGGGAGGLHFLGDGKPMCESFTSLLNNNNNNININVNSHGVGLFGGFEDGGFGFGIGRGVWPFSGVGDSGHYAAVGGGGGVGNTWQMESGEHMAGGGECFTLPELAISTPGMI